MPRARTLGAATPLSTAHFCKLYALCGGDHTFEKKGWAAACPCPWGNGNFSGHVVECAHFIYLYDVTFLTNVKIATNALPA